MSLLSTFICRDLVETNNYNFSESGLFCSPAYLEDQNGYLEVIKTLPLNPLPEVYGLHDNADITKDNQETALVNLKKKLNCIR